jgi:NADPH-dependent curcumin reductase CurA
MALTPAPPVRTNRRWTLARRLHGRVDLDAFAWTTGPVPAPGPGELLVRNLWTSVYPTQVLFLQGSDDSALIRTGATVYGTGAGRVVESRHPGFAPGDLVAGWLGWEDFTVTNGAAASPGDLPLEKLDPGVAPNRALGVLGITGMAAYFGVTEVGRAQRGETFVVTGAAGSVGSTAAQIARIRGCRVIGIVSGAERRDWLLRTLRLDGAIDRRGEDVDARLAALCPEGIDVFFDNAGIVPLLDTAIGHLRPRGRIVLCGVTSVYFADSLPPGPSNLVGIIMKQARIEGLLAREHAARFPEARREMERWIREGALTPLEEVVDGLEGAPAALARLFEGTNRGHLAVRIADG